MQSRNSRIEIVPMPRMPSEFPVIPLTVEFRNPETKRFLDGSHALHQAGGVRSIKNPVVQAVKEFEENNSFVSMHAVGQDDKFYIGNVARAYDNYLALSHMDDLQKYIPQLEDLADTIIDERATTAKANPRLNLDVPSQKEALLPFLAQVHLAKVNGVSPEKINFMINYEDNHPILTTERMKMVRESFEQGLSTKDVQSYIAKPYDLARDLQLAREGLTEKQFNVLLEAKDPSTVRDISIAFRFSDLPTDVAKAIVDFNNKLFDNYDVRKKLPTPFLEEHKVDMFVALSKDENIAPKEVEMIGNKILNTGNAVTYKEAKEMIGAVRDLQGPDKTVRPVKAWEPKLRENVKVKSNDELDR